MAEPFMVQAFQIFDGVEGSYHVQVRDDTDGIDMIQIDYVQEGKVLSFVRFTKEQAPMVIDAIRRIAEGIAK